jgi:hypothetical protein
VVAADADAQRPSVPDLTGHLALGLLALLIFAGLHLTTGRLEVGGGAGWDGMDYARMLRDGWSGGTVHTRLRPLVVWLAAPLYALIRQPVMTFDAMNVVYTGLYAILLSMLLARYGASRSIRAVAVVCIVLTNHFRLFAFYPMLVDLGACLLMTLALLLILNGPRWAAAATCVAAVLAREYAPIVVLFGVHRDVRRGVPLATTVATYAPAALVWAILRVVVMRTAVGPESPTTAGTFLGNMRDLGDPLFIGLFLHAVITVAGGLSMVVAAHVRRCWEFFTREPEWVTYAVPLLLVTVLGGADLWRYLTPMLPLVAILYARCAQDWRPRTQIVIAAVAIVLTLLTQQTFARMDSARYFADWFPYYIRAGLYPFSTPPPSIWPEWGWRLAIVGVVMCVLAVYANRRPADVST